MRRNLKPQPPTNPAPEYHLSVEEQLDMLIDLVNSSLKQHSTNNDSRLKAIPYLERELNIIFDQIEKVEQIESILAKLNNNSKISEIAASLNINYTSPYSYHGQVPVESFSHKETSPSEKLFILIENLRQKLIHKKMQIQIMNLFKSKKGLYFSGKHKISNEQLSEDRQNTLGIEYPSI